MLNQEEKSKIIKERKIHETDTGSDEVQVSLLSEEITRLLSHLKKHSKDFHSKRGLLKMVAKRRKLLRHLKDESQERYDKLIKSIGLKK
jgi:small subunit ribosomal protein S15